MNVCDFSPKELISEVKKYCKDYSYEYFPDIRDEFAKSWPYNYDDSLSRKDWGWNPKYNTVAKIAEVMFKETKISLEKEKTKI